MSPNDKVGYLRHGKIEKGIFIDYVKHHQNYRGVRMVLIALDKNPKSILKVPLTKIKKIEE